MIERHVLTSRGLSMLFLDSQPPWRFHRPKPSKKSVPAHPDTARVETTVCPHPPQNMPLPKMVPAHPDNSSGNYCLASSSARHAISKNGSCPQAWGFMKTASKARSKTIPCSPLKTIEKINSVHPDTARAETTACPHPPQDTPS